MKVLFVATSCDNKLFFIRDDAGVLWCLSDKKRTIRVALLQVESDMREQLTHCGWNVQTAPTGE